MFNKLTKNINKLIALVRFRLFELSIHPNTWALHSKRLLRAEKMALVETPPHHQSKSQESTAKIINKGAELRHQVLAQFKDLHANLNLRLLIHLPQMHKSPGGHSLFSNLASSMDYIGVDVCTVNVGDDINRYLTDFKPNIFISSDNESYTSTIDWNALNRYKCKNDLRVGLTASLQEYGNSPLVGRLKIAKKNNIDFFYSFRSQNYLCERIEYRSFYNEGYPLLSIEFGANPLIYYPVAAEHKDLNFIFLASSNPDKQKRYVSWLPSITKEYDGFIDGPGWKYINRWAPQVCHKYLYARSKVGLNLHIDDSIYWASELNERTYILAACGVPQLIDNPLLLDKRFSKDSMFSAQSPKEYKELFRYILSDHKESNRRALVALNEVFSSHTTLHRASDFICALQKI